MTVMDAWMQHPAERRPTRSAFLSENAPAAFSLDR